MYFGLKKYRFQAGSKEIREFIRRYTGMRLVSKLKRLPTGCETDRINVYLASWKGRRRKIVIKEYDPGRCIKHWFREDLQRLRKKEEIYRKGFGPRPLAFMYFGNGRDNKLLFVEEYVPGRTLAEIAVSNTKKEFTKPKGGDLKRLRCLFQRRFRILDVVSSNIIYHRKRGAQIVDFLVNPIGARLASDRSVDIILSRRGIVLRKGIREFFKGH